LYGKKLNCFGETSEAAITRLDLLKAASGGDYLTGEFKYENCFEFINRAALLFAGNHLPKLKVADQNNAFTERLLVVPFLHPVKKHEQDVHLLQKLLSEKPYITKWAITGLNRLVGNNFQFTKCEQSDEILAAYRRRINSVQMFVDECCVLDPAVRTHTYILEEAYRDFCLRMGAVPLEDKFFHDAIKSIPGVISSRFRVDRENRNGYIGIALYEP
jgi:putative DNA primase/helicase